MTVRVQRYVRVTVRQAADVRDGGHVSGGEMSYIGSTSECRVVDGRSSFLLGRDECRSCACHTVRPSVLPVGPLLSSLTDNARTRRHRRRIRDCNYNNRIAYERRDNNKCIGQT